MRCENGMDRLWPVVLLVVMMILAAVPAAAQSCDDPAVTLKYDHFKTNGPLSYEPVHVGSGDEILVEIDHTCPASFEYAYEGVESVPESPSGQAPAAISTCQISKATVCIRHEERFGSYLVHIEPKTSAVRTAELNGVTRELKSATLIIPVVTKSWRVDFSSGFTISELTDPVFAGRKATEDGEEITRIIRSREAEDDANLGIAAFTHLVRDNWRLGSWGFWGPTLGLGIDDRNKASYFLGASLHFGKQAALTAGYQWGSVDRLPGGLAVGDVLDDAALLDDLPDRTDGAVFVALSYSFLGGKDAFNKKIGDAGSSSGPAASAKKADGNDDGGAGQ